MWGTALANMKCSAVGIDPSVVGAGRQIRKSKIAQIIGLDDASHGF
ncbi:MAG: hypothetical protein NVS9B14_15640 [Candidatus Acidiferrum sp.]